MVQIIVLILFVCLGSEQAFSQLDRRPVKVEHLPSLSIDNQEEYGLHVAMNGTFIDIDYSSERWHNGVYQRCDAYRGTALWADTNMRFKRSILASDVNWGGQAIIEQFAIAAQTERKDVIETDIIRISNINSSSFKREPFNIVGWEGHPSFSWDGMVLFFASRREGGQGGSDIWYVILDTLDASSWCGPFNAGPTINSPADEISPYIAPDNVTLFFASNRLGGKGGFDIYSSKALTKLRKRPFGTAKFGNVESHPNLCGEYDDCFYAATSSKVGFMCSNRPRPGQSISSDLDIYSVTPGLDIDTTVYITYRLIDCSTGGPVAAWITLKQDDGLSQRIKTSPDGRRTIQKPTSEVVEVVPSEEDYQGFKIRMDDSQFPIDHEVKLYMSPPDQDCDMTIPLPTVHFELDSHRLLPLYVRDLDNFVNDLQSILGGGAVVKYLIVEGHTDENGEAAYNREELSRKRALAVRNYLQARLPTLIIRYEFYGEDKPIRRQAEAKTPSERSEIDQANRRVLLRLSLGR